MSCKKGKKLAVCFLSNTEYVEMTNFLFVCDKMEREKNIFI